MGSNGIMIHQATAKKTEDIHHEEENRKYVHSEGSLSFNADLKEKYDLDDHERYHHQHHGIAHGHGKGFHHAHHGLNAKNMELGELLDDIAHKKNRSEADLEDFHKEK